MNKKFKYLSISDFHLIILPVVISIVLFIVCILLVILPIYNNSLWERKLETIHEFTLSAWSVMSHHHNLETEGLLSRIEAQDAAISHVRAMRYGREMKDYFWINDNAPTINMHPYCPDLDGRSLRDFADPHGKLLFVEFVRIVKQDVEGYVDYMWQWKDDPDQIAPKISFVKGFMPWGWTVVQGCMLTMYRLFAY